MAYGEEQFITVARFSFLCALRLFWLMKPAEYADKYANSISGKRAADEMWSVKDGPVFQQ